MVPPITTVITDAAKPTMRDTRAPYMSADRTSLPPSSVPSGWASEGGWYTSSIPTWAWAYGSYGARKAAKTAASTATTSMPSPIAPIGRRMSRAWNPRWTSPVTAGALACTTAVIGYASRTRGSSQP